jgi:phenylacetate-CoA ligase
MTHYDARETQPSDERERVLFAQLGEVLAHAVKSAAGWAKRLGNQDPATIRTRTDLARLPILKKSDLVALQEQLPPLAGLVAREIGAFARLFLSPGPICEPQAPTPDAWGATRALFAAGVRKNDILLNTFSYHLTPGGFIFDAGALALGCAVIPAGPGNTEQQLQLLKHYRPSAYVGTADFLGILLSAFEQAGGTHWPIRRAILSGAAVPRALRDRFNGAGIAVHELYGTAELGVVAYETDAHDGLIVNEDVILEIVDPHTGAALAQGEVGEVVVTRLSRDYPLFRFATGDLSSVLSGLSRCGRTSMRLRGWLGRADQTTKVKGMFVHPAQVLDIIRRVSGADKGRLVIRRRDDRDDMILEVEISPDITDSTALTEALEEHLVAVTKLRGAVRVVAPGSIDQHGTIVDTRPR